MHLILLNERYARSTEELLCDWCHTTIDKGDNVWLVTVAESNLPGEIRTLDICIECSVVGSPEQLYNYPS